MKKPNLFYISTRYPWPKTSGRDLMIQQSIRALSRNYSIIFIQIGKASDAETPATVDHYFSIKRPGLIEVIFNLFSIKTHTLQESLFYSRLNTKTIECIKSKYRPHIVVFDMIRTTSYAQYFNNSILVCDMDDLLSRRYEQISQSNSAQGSLLGTYSMSGHFSILESIFSPFKRIIYLIEKRAIQKREDFIATNYGATILVSEREAQVLRARTNTLMNVFSAPPAIARTQGKSLNRTVDLRTDIVKLLFVGDMRTHANIESARYIIQNISPLLASRKIMYELNFAGRANPDLSAEISATPGCVHLGWVDDLAETYRQADFVICPFLVGTGIKVKVLEGMSYGRTVLTTSLGIDGINLTPGVHAILCHDPSDFVTEIERLASDPLGRSKIGSRARKLVENEHDEQRIEGKILLNVSTLQNSDKLATTPPTQN